MTINIQSAIQELTSALLPEYDDSEARIIAAMSLEKITGLDRTMQHLNALQDLTAEEFSSFQHIKAALSAGRPVQYVLEEAWFCGYKFWVQEGVLIPRPETEELVTWIGASVKSGDKILDIGTGSGCIAISLKRISEDTQVSAVDVSSAALDTARKNAQLLKAEVNFSKMNILDPNTWPKENAKWDVIVSNPPYVRMSEMAEMSAHVLNYEPDIALFVQDEDPLQFYKAIANFALQYLSAGGCLFFEINQAFGRPMKDLLLSKGFSDVVLRKDIYGRDRMVKAVWKSSLS